MEQWNDQAFLVVEDGRENNLQGVNLRLPKGKLILFTGVSGSGKSSVVFDTIAVEARRQLGETFPLYVRNRMPRYERPKAGRIDNLTAAIVIDQRPIGGGTRSTVGTVVDAAPLLRLLFSRCAQPSAGLSSAYSFNDPQGMCPTCSGLGRRVTLDLDKFLDLDKSLNEGAIRFPIFSVGGWQWQTYANSGLFDCDKPLREYGEAEWQELLHGGGRTVKIGNSAAAKGYSNLKYEGLVDRFERVYLNRDIGTLSEKNRAIVLDYIKEEDCPVCHGARLSQAALESRLCGWNIAELSAMEGSALAEELLAVEHPLGVPIVQKLRPILERMAEMGLGYLSLDRPTDSLSGGEAQRLKLVRHLGSSLTGITYIFDEPSAGLHPRDVERLAGMLERLRDRGNTLLVVEHDMDLLAVADQVVEMGPGAGTAGGRVIYQGSVAGLREADTPTGTALRMVPRIKELPRTPTGWLSIAHAKRNNLRDLSLSFPLGVLTVVTGVAGSGKSTLVFGELAARRPDAIQVDQSPIGTSSRSTPATYVGAMDDIRTLFAKANGVNASLFSFNAKGACPVCGGKGELTPDMAFMDPVTIPCEACGGKRYGPQALQYTLRGKNILEILDMTVDEALDFFPEKKIQQKLRPLQEVGMGYVTLGQSTASLSGGECQRVKLAEELHKSGQLYLLDEPTTGLHKLDVEVLLALMDRLVETGNTVIVVEHDQQVIAHADWVIDLGPEGGAAGGSLLYQGPVTGLLQAEHSHTGAFLRRALESK